MNTVLKVFGWFGVILILGYAIEWAGFENQIMQGIGEAAKTIGWGVYWGVALILRVLAELIVAMMDSLVNFFQGQAPWLPDVPRLQ